MNPILYAFMQIVMMVLNFLNIIVIISALLSWVSPDPNNPIVRFIHSVTEPMYRPMRKFTKKIPGPFDWSPLVVLLVIQFLLIVLRQYMSQMRGI